MRLGALGYFREAREQSSDLFSRQDDVFPVKMECMRLLFEQGDFEKLLNYTSAQFRGSNEQDVYSLDDIARHLRRWRKVAHPVRPKDVPEDEINTQRIMIAQMRHIAMLSRAGTDRETSCRSIALGYKLDHSDMWLWMRRPLQVRAKHYISSPQLLITTVSHIRTGTSYIGLDVKGVV